MRLREWKSLGEVLLESLAKPGFWSRLGLIRHRLTLSEQDRLGMRTALQTLTEVIRGYFTVFTNRFPSSSSARGWVEAGAIFVVGLNRVVREYAS